MRQYFAKRPLRQRIIALTAAYAIALSSLIASFGLARAAADTPAAAGVICHTVIVGDEAPSPASDQGTADHCAANCCIGCLMLLGALPAPPTKMIGAPQSANEPIALPQHVVLVDARHGKDHRSRAPPQTA